MIDVWVDVSLVPTPPLLYSTLFSSLRRTNFNIFLCVEPFILLRLHIEVEQARELLSTVQERIQIRRENT